MRARARARQTICISVIGVVQKVSRGLRHDSSILSIRYSPKAYYVAYLCLLKLRITFYSKCAPLESFRNNGTISHGVSYNADIAIKCRITFPVKSREYLGACILSARSSFPRLRVVKAWPIARKIPPFLFFFFTNELSVVSRQCFSVMPGVPGSSRSRSRNGHFRWKYSF